MASPENAAALQRLARHWGGRHGRFYSLIGLPALIGLVPMPAGALFSAPMVQQAAAEPRWAPAWKAAVNYWFRHVWEYWWPIYPAVIIGIAVFNMETWQFMAALAAFTPATFWVGYQFLLRPHREALALDAAASPPGALREGLRVLLPLGIIIAAVLLLPPAAAALRPGMDPQVRKLLAMLAGMLLGIGVIVRQEWGRRTGLLREVFRPHSLNVLLIVGGVAVFQSLLEASGLVPKASEDLLRCGIPLVPVIALLPFLAGLITGASAGFAGMTFPLVIGLMRTPGASLPPMAALVLAFGSGYLGMMVSPIHLCLLVTRDYFDARLAPIYRQILPCVTGMALFTGLLFLLFRALGW